MKLQGKALRGFLPNQKPYRIDIDTTAFSVKMKLQVKLFNRWFTSNRVERHYNITNDTFVQAFESACREFEPIINKKLITND